MDSKPTFSTFLKRWPNAGALSQALAAEGCTASEVLIRRWWNDEMLPPRAWGPLVRAAQTAGFAEITLDALAAIAEEDRETRLARSRAEERPAA